MVFFGIRIAFGHNGTAVGTSVFGVLRGLTLNDHPQAIIVNVGTDGLLAYIANALFCITAAHSGLVKIYVAPLRIVSPIGVGVAVSAAFAHVAVNTATRFISRVSIRPTSRNIPS